MTKALNAQIAMEANAVNSYLAAASWCEITGYDGAASFFYAQADEEKPVKKTEMKKQWEEYLPMSPEEKKQKLTDYIQSLRN